MAERIWRDLSRIQRWERVLFRSGSGFFWHPRSTHVRGAQILSGACRHRYSALGRGFRTGRIRAYDQQSPANPRCPHASPWTRTALVGCSDETRFRAVRLGRCRTSAVATARWRFIPPQQMILARFMLPSRDGEFDVGPIAGDGPEVFHAGCLPVGWQLAKGLMSLDAAFASLA